MRYLGLLSLVALGALASPLELRNDQPSFYNAKSQSLAPEYSVRGPSGAVSTEVDICSNVGAELLERGGSSADAIIGASLCVGSIAAFHSGIGGGGFGLIREGKGEINMIDFRETMPAAGNETLFKDNPNTKASLIGGLAAGVPGEIRAWQALHEKYGKLKWQEIFQPAITINRKGFKIPNQLGVALSEKSYPMLCSDPYWTESYCPNGTIKKEGDTVIRERYAETLEMIAKQGPDAFYKGRIADDTIYAARARGGIMTQQDFDDYTVEWRTPNSIEFAGKYKVYSGVSPCSGNAVLSTLKTVDQYEKAEYNLETHRIIEATKFAYGERSNYGDPAFVPDLDELQAEHISDSYAKSKSSKIKNDSVQDAAFYNPTSQEILNDSGTSQLTVVDKDDLSITLTTTINTFWGSQVMTAGGVILNNEMDDFSTPGVSNFFGLAPSEANFIRGGKRPLSSISPMIVEDSKTGKLVLATGSAGGSKIITAVIQLVYGVLHEKLDLQTAINRGRWHHQLSPNQASFEWKDDTIPGYIGFDNSTVAFLKGIGHNVTWVATGSSTPQGVQVFQNKTLLAATEVRQLSARGAAF